MDNGENKYTFQDLVRITATLRGENGCPWDRAQTHESMKVCLQEECQEVLDAIDHQDVENLCEELGDVLFQVMIHSQIEQEKGNFTIDDVINGICEKMVRRHPHVFGDKKIHSEKEGAALWEELKNLDKLRKNGYKDK